MTKIWTSPYPPIDVDGPPLPDLIRAAAERAPGAAAVVDGPTGATVTYGELVEGIDRVAGGLAERGFGRGDVMALLGPNGAAWIEAAFGAMVAGGAVTGLSTSATDAELRKQVETTRASLLVSVEPREGWVGVDELLAAAPAGSRPALDLDATALLPCSSGTTGLPKAVVLTHRNLACATAQLRTGAALTERDVLLGIAPYQHIMGFAVTLSMPLAAGATVVTLPKFGVDALLDVIEARRPTALIGPPPVLAVLAGHPAVAGRDLSSLEVIAGGGAPVPAALQEAVQARFPDAIVFQGYGMTETSAPIPIPDRRTGTPPGSVGRLAPNTELRVVNPATGEDLGAGEHGELWVRGPQNCSGYLGRPDATAELIDSQGWLRTGDIGWIGEDGNLHVVDRLKSLIKVNALQVAPAELEALLTTHPAVADAAVIARPDERTGEIPVAVVVSRGELDSGELMDWVAERVAPHKRIRAVRIVEQIPRTPSGKTLHRQLMAEDRELVAEGRQPVG